MPGSGGCCCTQPQALLHTAANTEPSTHSDTFVLGYPAALGNCLDGIDVVRVDDDPLRAHTPKGCGIEPWNITHGLLSGLVVCVACLVLDVAHFHLLLLVCLLLPLPAV